MSEWVPFGTVVKPHGIRGEIKVFCESDEPSLLKRLTKLRIASRKPATVHALKRFKFAGGLVILALEGVDDRNAAEALRNAELEALGTELPPLQNDEYWLYELRGAEAQDEAGDVLGEVVRVVSNSMKSSSRAEDVSWYPARTLRRCVYRRVPSRREYPRPRAARGSAQMSQRPFRLDIITLTPDIWPTLLSEATGLVGRAFRDSLVEYGITNLRDYGKGVHRQVDDTPFGGGPGMLIEAAPTIEAISHVKGNHNGPVVMLSPRGERFSQSIANSLALEPGMTLLCGRYEGFDERVRRHVDIDLSLGDFVLSGGDPAAWAITDAVVRRLPLVLGNAASVVDESFEIGGLEHPQYTRPAELNGLGVPEVLRSGDHAKIKQWREQAALALTKRYRPDLTSNQESKRLSELTSRIWDDDLDHER